MSKLIQIDIDQLRPTQFSLGLDEVKQRREDAKKLSEQERRDLVVKKAVPYVLGPQRQIFMMDHHHFCRVMHDLGCRQMLLGDQDADWSDLERERFWKRMEKKNRCQPIDAVGNRRPCSKMPAHVKDLPDNPWRTLVRGVRDVAYKGKKKELFQEFQRGNYFRSFMTARLLETDMGLAERLATQVTHLDEARDLPGYQGPR